MFNRKEYGLELTEDVTLMLLLKGKFKDFHSQIEPCNFNILSNQNYHKKLLFTPIYELKEREQREHVDQTITSLFGVSRLALEKRNRRGQKLSEIYTAWDLSGSLTFDKGMINDKAL